MVYVWETSNHPLLRLPHPLGCTHTDRTQTRANLSRAPSLHPPVIFKADHGLSVICCSFFLLQPFYLLSIDIFTKCRQLSMCFNTSSCMHSTFGSCSSAPDGLVFAGWSGRHILFVRLVCVIWSCQMLV